jgi:hypothetical protein
VLWLLAAVFLLPVYGSWVDFHYPERQPAHKHIYLGRVNLNHHRDFDTGDIIMLPDQDATGQPIVLLFPPEAQALINSAASGNLSFDLSDEFHSPDDAFLPPPDHPPRS